MVTYAVCGYAVRGWQDPKYVGVHSDSSSGMQDSFPCVKDRIATNDQSALVFVSATKNSSKQIIIIREGLVKFHGAHPFWW